MGQYFDAFIPNVYKEDSLDALRAFAKKIGAYCAYAEDAQVFNLSLKNTIYSLDGNHYWEDGEDAEAPITKFLKEFRATEIESHWPVEIFLRPEGEEHWHAFAHNGKSRTCCHLAAEETMLAARNLMSEAQGMKNSVASIHADNVRLRGNFQVAVNEAVMAKLALWNHSPAEKSEDLKPGWLAREIAEATK